MTKDEYVKRLEEIMAKYAIQIMGTYQGATSLGVDGFNAISAIQQLNNEAMPQKKDATDGKDYFYSPEVKIAVANYNQAIDELRAVIGQDKEQL